MLEFNRQDVINGVLGFAIGMLLSMNGMTIFTVSYWIFLVLVIMLMHNNSK